MIQDVLDFWFSDRARELWFLRDGAFDTEILDRFQGLAEAAAAGELDDWLESAKGTLALIILLDQFPRNMHRGSALAFATDAKARSAARLALDRGYDQGATDDERCFLYLPFEHSEDLADQNRSVRLFEMLGDARWIDYAVRHREIVARFGRFPHRNAVLGRPSTPEEEAFLEEPQSSF
jgi:uncharacterized protein (DUF924 family)